MPIRAILETDYGPVFGPEEVAILATAFDATLKTLGLVDRKDPMTTAVAKLVIQIAREDGERDPEKLCELSKFYANSLDQLAERASRLPAFIGVVNVDGQFHYRRMLSPHMANEAPE